MHKTAMTGDVHIREIKELIAPEALLHELQPSAKVTEMILRTRQEIHRILDGQDDRLVVVTGPCSIHDPDAGIAYAKRLVEQRHRYSSTLLIVMRAFFEKPRTTLGWKGLINDPALDGSFQINAGLRLARSFLLNVSELSIPIGTEFLDTISPQYTADLISWGAIGARTTESQVHRELASGLSCPIGFKNGTDGNIQIAVDAIQTAGQPHQFLGVTKAGHAAIIATTGNQHAHLILRGGKKPNFDSASIDQACTTLVEAGLPPKVMIDCSHANSRKQFKHQRDVANNLATQIACGDHRIFGIMLESHLHEGRQDMVPGGTLEYGKSITDACLGWEDTVEVLKVLSQAVTARRQMKLAQRIQ
jgi:3-deoxy-7-phosphoheptulonate synthase